MILDFATLKALQTHHPAWRLLTWLPGKTLARFITATFGIPEKEQKQILERISDAVSDYFCW